MAVKFEGRMCPKCEVMCSCSVCEIEEGGHYYDEYTRCCPECGNTLKKRVYKGSLLLGTSPTSCPFCRETSKDHPRTPKKPP